MKNEEDLKYLGEKFPMGVTQWADYGKALGYWDYFKKEATELALLERDIEWRNEYNSMLSGIIGSLTKIYHYRPVDADYTNILRLKDDLINSMK